MFFINLCSILYSRYHRFLERLSNSNNHQAIILIFRLQLNRVLFQDTFQRLLSQDLFQGTYLHPLKRDLIPEIFLQLLNRDVLILRYYHTEMPLNSLLIYLHRDHLICYRKMSTFYQMVRCCRDSRLQ